MRSPVRTLALVSLLVGGCGGGASAHDPDAATDTAPPIDVPPLDAPPAGCDYSEQHDLTNDVIATGGIAEATGITLATRAVICGAFEHTHFDGDLTVDVDTYVITLAAPADVLVRLHGAGAESIELVGVDVYGGPTFAQHVAAVTFYGDHGVTAVHLAAGTYQVIPFALASAAIAATLPYKLELALDAPDTRCAALTSGGYAEAHDGASSTGNDVVQIPSGAPPALTTSTADAPEPSGLVLAPASRDRLTGTAADVATADQYEDKDAFALASGTANELTVRLAWSGTANLDFFLFEAGNPDPVLRALATTAGTETATFSLKPSTDYWLLVGALAGGTGLPASYAATVCGASYLP